MRLEPGEDPREAFASWLTAPGNPWFARAAVNRAWFWLVGRGIVHEPDDLRADNPPSHPELLAFLERELVASRFDMKQVLPADPQLERVSAVVDSGIHAAPRRTAPSPVR